MASVKIRATQEAAEAYNDQDYEILLYILDGDTKNPGDQKKEVFYNFPPKFFGEGKIKLDQPPGIAKFKLVPLAPERPAVVPP